ncbi:hypothetical protein GCM10027048_27480 [Hymenobacter coalescens]
MNHFYPKRRLPSFFFWCGWLVTSVLLSAAPAWAQRECGTPTPTEWRAQLTPAQRMVYDQVTARAEQAARGGATASRTAATGVITIPVVVHVVYNTAAQNISDAQIQSQIDVLNKDFTRTNADAGNTPAVFQGVASTLKSAFRWPRATPTATRPPASCAKLLR